MDSGDFSKAGLAGFLDMLVSKGLVNTNTGAGWKTAFATILEDIPDTDDVRAIDLPTAIRRYHNRHPNELAPDTLQRYEYRLQRLLAEYVKYMADPAGYRPPAGRGLPQPKKGNTDGAPRFRRLLPEPPPPGGMARNVAAAASGVSALAAVGSVGVKTTPGLTLEFPMRPDFLAQVVIPRDMNKGEARRFAAFIMTLATDFVPPEGG
jgi:hypothetical protein